ncbi:DNA polymerase III subunit delta, partial [Candidatus Pelagibacter sp.]|nr:DNA polymerase III subunit delta [Candidatus Pelagibacter sp.]
NVLIERSRGDRKNLNNELEKIENFLINKKKLNIEEIIKLTNLADNYSASELVDYSLAKNTRKTVTILNENNYSDEDNIIIIRTLSAKLKRLVKIYELIDEKNNIEQAISACKPPIFWKDKSIVTQQIQSWKKEHLKNLIYKTNEVELLIKKNSNIAKNILSDFIIDNSRKTNN